MSVTSTERECISIERINQYINNQTEEIHKIQHSSNKSNKVVFSNSSPETNTIIEFKNVWLKYDKDSSNYALKNLSFQIEKHQKIAFCGRTGCGKTSILNCLFKLYDIDQGEIFFKGNQINSLSLHDLRGKIVNNIILLISN